LKRASVRKAHFLTLLAAAAALSAYAQENARPAPAPPNTPTEVIGVEALRADFAELYARLKSAHFNLYARVSKVDYDRLYASMLRDIRRPETRAEAGRRFQRFVAFGRVAHARIDENYRSFSAWRASGGRFFPLSLRFRGDRLFVSGNGSGLAAIQPGDEVMAMAGVPAPAWLEPAHRNISADTDYMAGALLELDWPMLLWIELGPAETIGVEIRKPDGRRLRLLVPMRTREEIAAALASGPPRLELPANARIARILPGNVAYLHPGPFYAAEPDAADPYDNARFRAFIEQSFEHFLAAGADRLIVDLRDNPGGDSSFSDLMLDWFADRPFRFASAFRIKVSPEAIESNRKRLEAAGSRPDPISARFAALYAAARPGEIVDFPVAEAIPRPGGRFAGKVFLLVNRNSYSNSVAVAATIQDYRLGKVVGEETSDLATTYGAMETFTLPRTGLQVGFPKAYIVRPSGGTEARGVVPDIAIETPLIEGPDDPVLARAVELALARPANATAE
jgi:hypothetical protein